MTNELVNDSEGCLDLAKDAVHSIDSTNFGNLSVSPRKSLEIPALVLTGVEELLCYFPGENSWWKLGETPSECNTLLFPCKWHLYVPGHMSKSAILRYNPDTKSWMRLAVKFEENRYSRMHIFVGNDEAYALVSDNHDKYYYYDPDTVAFLSWRDAWPVDREHSTDPDIVAYLRRPVVREHSTFILKYKPESQSWQEIVFLDSLCPFWRYEFCIVASENFIYFIGGLVRVEETNSDDFREKYLSDVDRYDRSKHQWEKVADIQMARGRALGAALNGKVFIAGGLHQGQWLYDSCEMYNESTNQWQFIAGLKKPETLLETLLAADGKLYAVSCRSSCRYPTDSRPGIRGYNSAPESYLKEISVECYNVDKNEWEFKPEITINEGERGSPSAGACSVRFFKGISNIFGLEPFLSKSLSRKAHVKVACEYSPLSLAPAVKAEERKCFIM